MSTTWDSAPERPQPLPGEGLEGWLPPQAPGVDGPSAPPPVDPAPTGEDAWPAWLAPVGPVAGLLVALVGGLIVALIGAAFGSPLDAEQPAPGILLGGTVAQDIGFVAAAVLLAAMTAGRPWAAQFGLRRTHPGRAVLWIGALYVGFIAFTALWQAFVKIDEDTELLDDLGANRSDLLLVLSAILVCVLAPLVEELFFRGFFFRALFNWRGLWPAAILTGVVFGAIHFGSSPVGAIVPLMVFGFGLCLLYWKTGSLYPCIAVHAINNSIAFGSLMEWTWQIPVLMVASLATCAAVCALASRFWRPPAGAPATSAPAVA